jgi:hypothetical protein
MNLPDPFDEQLKMQFPKDKYEWLTFGLNSIERDIISPWNMLITLASVAQTLINSYIKGYVLPRLHIDKPEEVSFRYKLQESTLYIFRPKKAAQVKPK